MTTTATAPEATLDTVETVPSFVRDSWWTPDAGSAASAVPVRDASTGEILAKVSTDGLDLAAVVDYGRTIGQTELGKLTFHQRALKLKELAQYLNARREALLRLLRADRRHQDRLDDRHRRRHRRAVHVRLQGPAGAAQRPGGGGRAHGGAVQGRFLCRRAHLHPHPRRRRADQRLQLPGLGHAGEARSRFHRRCPHHRQAGHPTGYVAAAVVKAIIESNILPKGSCS
jgi:oxepin-CoA hydrolase/3-oxo-5,6-dehydrosuberyl-CoA semialdehyde dehydrogenase